MTAITLARATGADDVEAVRALFLEYAGAPGLDAGFEECLAQQSFGAELAGLPGAYAPPRGALLLARADGEPAGCVALKPLEPASVCEMKRLFVRPAFRELGLGRRLVAAIMAAAADAGYTHMRLDTLPSMAAAQQLYRRLGFYDIPAYCENPVRGARFMEADLTASRATA
ncbi:MAG TPA: GNAT family N-acetyltransferase [Gemmatimonadaceae bacterium]|nr:GNAT family N-acetyltransferase [Gemmatimonadaceae bacterium]